jgi:2,3-dihydroxybenzoate-AMP ligase
MLEGCVPWPETFVQRYKAGGYWEDIPIGEHLSRWVDQYGPRPAIAYLGQEVTYREMDTYATRLAYHMIQSGVKTYDRVIFQLFNCPELIYLFYACMKIGAIPICSLATHRHAEIAHFAKTTDARVHAIPAGKVKDFDFEDFAEQIRKEAPNLEVVFTVDKTERSGHVSIDEVIQGEIDMDAAQKALAQYRPDPMEPAVFQLSGGTTGVPKIVPRTHNDYYYNAKCEAINKEFNQGTRCLIPAPLMHNFPLVCGLLPAHLQGGMVVLLPDTKTESLFQAIATHKVNTLTTVPVFIHRMLEAPEEQRRKHDMSSFKYLFWGGNPVDPVIQLKFRDVFDCESNQVYGMAEGLICWTRMSDPLEIKLHTQGRPDSEADEVKAADINTGEEVPIGEIGECWVRGPYTIRGYYKAEEHNNVAFTPDGFYKTGDLIRKDREGNITIVGRIKDCISRGAEKINAEEVEIHIVQFPKVRNAALVAMPDKVMGERACVFVVPVPGETFTLDELNGFLLNKRKIAKFKLPERLEFIDELPVTKVGKFEKKSLREKIAVILQTEGKKV